MMQYTRAKAMRSELMPVKIVQKKYMYKDTKSTKSVVKAFGTSQSLK